MADTSFVIDVMRKERSALQKANELSRDGVPLIIGTPTVFELFVGVGLSRKSPQEKRRVQDVLASVTQLPLDTRSATRAGLVYAQRTKEASGIDPEDAMIAGIAIENGETLLTRNRRDFEGIDGLRLESY